MRNITVTTSWDDGHILDLKLATLLKKYGIAGTFYISPQDRQIVPGARLQPEQIRKLSQDFEIGAHTMTHPSLLRISDEEAFKEIEESKIHLEGVLGAPVTSFCYPSGCFERKHVAMIQRVGFTLARTVIRFKTSFQDALVLPTTVHAYRHWSDAWPILKQVGVKRFLNCYLNWDELAIALFDQTPDGATFHLWGHSWEIDAHNEWERLEKVLKHIANRKDCKYVSNHALVDVGLKRKRTALFVTPYFLPHGGGLERYVYEIASRLRNKYQWDVVIVTSGEKGNEDTVENFHGLTVYRLGYQVKISNTPFSFRWSKKIRSIIEKVNPTVVNIHMPVPGIGDVAAHSAGEHPMVLTYHAGTMKKGKFLADTVIWLYERFVLPHTVAKVQKIICSSKFVKRTVFAKCPEIATVVTPGVDVELFTSNANVQKKENEIVFICNFASMHRLKGLYVLIDAIGIVAATFPDISLKVIGERGTVNSKFVHFVGPKSGEELVREIQTADILALCSLAPAESFGMVLIEAMACKVPVIGTEAGGIPEVIEDGVDGIIVPSGDSVVLARAINLLLSNRALAIEMGVQGQKKVIEGYTWEKKVAETEVVFENILQSNLL